MSLKSAAGEEFLKTLENLLGSQTEVLILICYTRAAGNKDFEFYKSPAGLQIGCGNCQLKRALQCSEILSFNCVASLVMSLSANA